MITTFRNSQNFGRWIFTVLLFLPSAFVLAQQPGDALQEMLDAENAFARMSKEKNTKTAFLAYLSDSSVMFDQSRPVKGRKSWEQKKEGKELLFWWPAFAGISADGKLGFTTGPWEFSPSRTQQAVAFGHYATVWEKGQDGSWKMAADIGISIPEAHKENLPLTFSSCQSSPEKNHLQSADPVKKDLWQLALGYDDKLRSGKFSLLADYCAKDIRILRENQFPYVNVPSFSEGQDRRFDFQTTGIGMSSSLDVAYTYGIASSHKLSEAESQKTHHYFMKVWKRENDQWKVVLDVLGGA